MTDRRTSHLVWFPALVLVVTVVELVAAVAVPGTEQFDDKGWSVRLVAYPVLMLLAPALWWATRGRDGRREPPYVAFGLVMLPFLLDTTANWLDLFRQVGWWDDLSHALHWFLLCSGLGLLIAPLVRPRWVVVPLVGGLGALFAIAWELGEYWLFIRHGTESGGAYRDTLGDETLGSCGALLAGTVLVWWTTRATRTSGHRGVENLREPSPAEGSTGWFGDVASGR